MEQDVLKRMTYQYLSEQRGTFVPDLVVGKG